MKADNKPKEQFKERLMEWSERRLGHVFGNLNHPQQSRQMIQFFLLEVLERLSPGLVPDEEEIENYIVDGPGDGGADFLYRTDEGRVVIVQAKYRGNDAREDPADVGRLCDFLQRLYQATHGIKGQTLRTDMLELASQIDWEEDTFDLFFITTAKASPATQQRADQGIVEFREVPDLADRADLNYYDKSMLNQQLREAISASEFPAKPVTFRMLPDEDGNAWCHFSQESHDLYIGEVSGTELAQVLQEHRASLFTMNIRDYVGDTKVNKQIIETARKQPANFEYFNNGVTAVAGRIEADRHQHTLKCDKLSIINGAQTVRSLHAAHKKKKDDAQYHPVREVRVVLRLITYSFPDSDGFVAEVTKYNNTQNSVKVADFRSNDPVQRDLSRRFYNLNLGGKHYDYRNKRGDRKMNTAPIAMEEFTKSIYAFRFGPDDMAGGTARLFDASSQGLYRKLYPSPDEALSERDFLVLAGTFFLCQKIKELWEQERRGKRAAGETMPSALERKGLVYYTVGEFQREAYKRTGLDLDDDLARLARNNSWILQGNSQVNKNLGKLYRIASKVLRQQYKADEKDAAFKHRNWFRDSATLTAVNKCWPCTSRMTCYNFGTSQQVPGQKVFVEQYLCNIEKPSQCLLRKRRVHLPDLRTRA